MGAGTAGLAVGVRVGVLAGTVTGVFVGSLGVLVGVRVLVGVGVFVGVMVGANTVVLTVDVLFARFKSASSSTTVAVLISVPALHGITSSVTEVLLPFGSVPKLQLTVPLTTAQLPWRGETDIKVTPLGSGSLKVTPVAVSGPLFCTLIPY